VGTEVFYTIELCHNLAVFGEFGGASNISACQMKDNVQMCLMFRFKGHIIITASKEKYSN
jgi:hypothetical protein